MRSWWFWWRPPCVLRLCIVNFKHSPDESLKGVLWQSRGQWLTFKSCSLLKPNSESVAMDGEIVIHRSTVSFLQVIE